jgi:N utilization substance protein A
LGEGLVEKLNAAGITSVEALADMTPEQLEAIEGIGPKTVEKISLAVNNYFASLDGGEGAALESGEAVEGEDAMSLEAGAEEVQAGEEQAAEDVSAAEEVQGEDVIDASLGDVTSETETDQSTDDKQPEAVDSSDEDEVKK